MSDYDDDPIQPLPVYSIELVEDLADIHPAEEVINILLNPLFTAEQRLHNATVAAAKYELIRGIRAEMRDDHERRRKVVTVDMPEI